MEDDIQSLSSCTSSTVNSPTFSPSIPNDELLEITKSILSGVADDLVSECREDSPGGATGSGAESLTPSTEVDDSLPQTVEEWLVPGRQWKGVIIIPGDPLGNRPINYFFEVCENADASDGNPKTIYAWHADDHDRQTVIVGVDGDSLSWHDFETYIDAKIDTTDGKITGRVRQLLEGGEDGFWHFSEDSVHTCSLEPSNPENALVKIRLSRRRLIGRLLETIGKLFNGTRQELPTYPEKMPWKEIFDEACAKSMIFQADMRRDILRLQEMTFSTYAQKDEEIAKLLCSNGLNKIRVQTHARAHDCTREFRFSLHAIKNIANLDPQVLRGLEWTYRVVETRSRRVFDQLDAAIRQFECRVPEEGLLKCVVEETDDQCAICLASVDAASWVRLPCNHVFHLSCARSWFHRSSDCPCCRAVLT